MPQQTYSFIENVNILVSRLEDILRVRNISNNINKLLLISQSLDDLLNVSNLIDDKKSSGLRELRDKTDALIAEIEQKHQTSRTSLEDYLAIINNRYNEIINIKNQLQNTKDTLLQKAEQTSNLKDECEALEQSARECKTQACECALQAQGFKNEGESFKDQAKAEAISAINAKEQTLAALALSEELSRLNVPIFAVENGELVATLSDEATSVPSLEDGYLVMEY